MFEKCVDCEKLGKTCSGPDIYLFSAEELISWCKRRKEYLHLSNAKIAEAANMARGTVDNLFANTHPDFRYETIRPILQVLISKTGVQETCIAPTSAETDRIKAEIEHTRSENARLQAALERTERRADQEMIYMHEQLEDVQQLAEGRKRIIYILMSALVLLLCLIIAVLIYDKTHPGIGYFNAWGEIK